jgi:hypothetical protein
MSELLSADQSNLTLDEKEACSRSDRLESGSILLAHTQVVELPVLLSAIAAKLGSFKCYLIIAY